MEEVIGQTCMYERKGYFNCEIVSIDTFFILTRLMAGDFIIFI